MNPDGTGQTNPTHNPARERGSAWSPDGTKIVINTGPSGSGKTTLLTGICGAGTGKSPSPGITALQA